MKKLRRKIVIAALAAVTGVFALTVLITGLALNINAVNRADGMTEIIYENDGVIPRKTDFEKQENDNKFFLYDFDEESRYRTRYFLVYFSGEKVTSVDIEHVASVDKSKAVRMSKKVKAFDKKTGYFQNFRYRVGEKNDCVIFLDCSNENAAVNRLIVIISLISLMFIILITVVFYFVSKRVVRPFEENSRMQKQFITDASHELKTPLAIISANAEVLAYKNGENEWINNITAQTARVNELINELLTLNRLEEVETNIEVEPVNLSEITEKTFSEFDEVFNSKNVSVENQIEKDVVINGNLNQLKRLVSVLAENASKYVLENGEVKLNLSQTKKHTVLTVFNSCEIDDNADYKHLFDRFYRPDSSRTSKTGGHGIGLSIAKRITILHNGSIEARPEEGGLCFYVTLSNKLKLSAK